MQNSNIMTNELLSDKASIASIIIENLAEGVYAIDHEGYLTFVNTSAAKMLGWQAAELIGQHGHNTIHYKHADGTPYPWESCSLVEVLKSGKPLKNHEDILVRKDGSVFPVMCSSTPIMNEGEMWGSVLSFVDITEQKASERSLHQREEEVRKLNEELEQRVIDRTVKLKKANEEMEAFTYSVSHDLRAPLRGLQGFSQALLEDYSDKLDSEGREYLSFISQNSHKMGELIDGLLTLSRLNRLQLSIELVNLSEIAQELTTNVRRTEQKERQVDIKISENLIAYGDKRLLRQVLQNLLENAWKFTSKVPLGYIEIGCQTQNSQTVYFVKDNGAGFNMAFQDKLFGAFQRLHKSDEYPGTGIGLATVARIIDRHGGQVWAESIEGQGATFYFTLNKEQAYYE